MIKRTKNKISPLIPFRFFPENPEETAAEITRLCKDYRLYRIMLCWPPKSDRSTGLPQIEKFAKLGKTAAALRKKVPEKVELNWWFSSTLKTGAGFTPVTDCRGVTAPFSSCPLDENFRKRVCDGVQAFIKEAHPPLVLLEDDFQLANHPGLWFGCCCDLHLKKFNDLNGTNYSRDDLKEIWSRNSSESIALRLKYSHFCADTLVDFAGAISHAAAAADPQTRLGLCQDGSWPRDGNGTVRIARALAGKNRPFVRLYGSSYCVDTPTEFPEMEFMARYCLEHFPEEIECLMEIDTYPHTTWFSSVGRAKTLSRQSLFSGGDDFLYYALQYLNDPLEEKAYLDYWKKAEKQLNVLKEEASGFTPSGVRIHFNPDAPAACPCDGRRNFHVRTPWSEVLGRMGIPYTTGKAACTMLSGRENVLLLKDEEIRSMLSGGLILDGGAARTLLERGYGQWLGVKLSEHTFVPPSLERILSTDQELYNFILAPAGSEVGSNVLNLEPLPGAEVLSVYESNPRQITGNGMIRFANALGGRIVVIPLVFPTLSSNIFCYRKQQMLRELINWCSGKELYAAVTEVSNVWLSTGIDSHEKQLLLSIVNLSPDIRKSMKLVVAQQFAGADAEILTLSGKWKKLPVKCVENKLVLKTNFETLDPVIIKLSISRETV